MLLDRSLSVSILSLCLLAPAFAAPQDGTWRYYRPSNTGIQGDDNEALWVDAAGNPYIAGYQPSFEEGGFAKFVVAENRWVNYSNVDYPVIGHPNDQGSVRIRDIAPDSTGKLWMGTWRGALRFDPAVGGSSLARFNAANSSLSDGFVTDIDSAPDGTVWFANEGIVRFNPTTNTWTRWNSGYPFLAVQPKASGGYLVWTCDEPSFLSPALQFDSTTQTWTTLTLTGAAGQVVAMPGKDCVDDTGHFWALRSTTPGGFPSLDYRQPNGVWVAPPEPYVGAGSAIWAFKAYGDRRALFVDGNGAVYQFNGSTWANLGAWKSGAFSYSLDIDSVGNVWVSGVGGAARRDVTTGQWQRYRVTNTSQFDFFNNDIAIDPVANHVYVCANATAGVGGMARFDGQRWLCWNNTTYGLGNAWPFNIDNSAALAHRPSNGHIALAPYESFHGIHEWTGSSFTTIENGVGAEQLCEDSLGRLWALGEYFSLGYYVGTTWTPVGITAWGSKLQKDPERPGTVWATTGHEIKRTDGSYSFSRGITDFPELSPVSDTFTGLAAANDGVAWVGATVQFGGSGTGGALIKVDANDGSYQMLRYDQGWPFPGQFVQPLAVTPDGRLWMQYDGDFFSTQRGLCWWDGVNVGVYPAPPGGEPQWGGLPHAAIQTLKVREIAGGYELWLSCMSRGIAVLTIENVSPWTKLGGSISGSAGTPVLAGAGNFAGQSNVQLTLSHARPNVPNSALIIGATQLGIPYFGGTLIPAPNLVITGLPTGPSGGWQLSGAIPPGIPAGTSLYFQVWLPDPNAVLGLAASNGLKATTP